MMLGSGVFDSGAPAVANPNVPLDLGVLLWLDSSVAGSITGNPVSQWNDLSGNLRHQTQASSTLRPIISPDTVNGKPMVRFDGTDDLLTNTSANPASVNWSIFTVAKLWKASVGSEEFVCVGLAGNTGAVRGFNRSTGGFLQLSTRALVATSTTLNMPVGELHAIGCVQEGMNVLLTKNGTTSTHTLSGAALVNVDSGINIGHRPFQASSWGNSDMVEALVFPTNLTVANREKIEGYLCWKWGLQANLPTGHPYKNYAP